MPPTMKELEQALNALRIARKQSSQHFMKVSFSKDVQSIFDYYDTKELLERDETILHQEYDSYFDRCERANTIPLTFETWKGTYYAK